MQDTLIYTLDFLRDLHTHNHHAWFTAHRHQYEFARVAFEQFIEALLERFGYVEDLGSVILPETLYPIYRLAPRASRAAPYKTAMSALIGINGCKTCGGAYYLHLEPNNQSFLLISLFNLTPGERAYVQRHADPQRLSGLRGTDTFQQYFGSVVQTVLLRTLPEGHLPEAVVQARSQPYTIVYPFSDDQILSEHVVDDVLDVCHAAQPMLAYLNTVLAEYADAHLSEPIAY